MLEGDISQWFSLLILLQILLLFSCWMIIYATEWIHQRAVSLALLAELWSSKQLASQSFEQELSSFTYLIFGS